MDQTKTTSVPSMQQSEDTAKVSLAEPVTILQPEFIKVEVNEDIELFNEDLKYADESATVFGANERDNLDEGDQVPPVKPVPTIKTEFIKVEVEDNVQLLDKDFKYEIELPQPSYADNQPACVFSKGGSDNQASHCMEKWHTPLAICYPCDLQGIQRSLLQRQD